MLPDAVVSRAMLACEFGSVFDSSRFILSSLVQKMDSVAPFMAVRDTSFAQRSDSQRPELSSGPHLRRVLLSSESAQGTFRSPEALPGFKDTSPMGVP